ncbi:MAG: Phenylalanine-tRNA ligase beta subunit [Candidatus Roizmanbacteria bacterium GW2011_GWA2_36_23]|uniref:phenylalanine--tRNA ligase n=1 Tax=Candidatus Roizmanbacteria bacterium GW2011_GWA2_36_23 TaxID=1618480 RepID=A0A0G0E799_9BACT|nr:MAG: Phenylalanine-tRNA ligase beta subunit [Candidatus Roizmanbacteria bacterium GW2011_GWA2_36_23]
MNIKITHNWLLEYLDTEATPEQIQKYLSLCGPSVESVVKNGDDYIYDIEITSNRIDTASVIGIAREAAVILKRFGIKSSFKPLQVKEPVIESEKPMPLVVTDKSKLCKRIMAVVMDNITTGNSPQFIKDRLEAAGIRSLNNLVDITNYVMTETGQPTHVFDYDRIKTNKFIIRNAKEKELIVTLDEKKYILSSQDVIIDDGTGRVIDLPGIMGTANSVVTSDTKRIIFFLETNNATTIRRSSMRYGIRTVAATINEKNPDPLIAKTALFRGVELFKKYSGAKVAGGIIDIFPDPEKPVFITTTIDFIIKRIGIDIPEKQITDILKDLNFKVLETGNKLKLQIPSFRQADVTIAEDLVEEIARIYGYFNLPNRLQPMAYVKRSKEMELLFVYQNKIKLFLKHLGLHEVINYSMISKEMMENNGLTDIPHLTLQNSISEDIKYLRTDLMPSLIKNIKENEGKISYNTVPDESRNLRMFEIGKTYIPRVNDLPIEEYKVGIITNTDFADMKGICDALMSELHFPDYEISRGGHPLLNPSNLGEIRVGKELVAEFGQLKAEYKIKNKLKNDAYLAIFDFSKLIKYSRDIADYKPINPYATIKLDLTVEANPGNPYRNIKKTVYQLSKLLADLRFLGAYQNKISLRFFFSSKERNITEEEAKEELEKIKKNIWS